jgi:hypothetical protein
MAPPHRQPKPGSGEALAEIVAAQEEARRGEAVTRGAVIRRAGAIKHGIERGLTLKQIGEVLGVSAERVRQMRDVE